jgi:hypothetical protein
MVLTPLLSYSFLQPAAYLPKDYFAQDSADFYTGAAKGQQGQTAEMGYFPKTMDVLLDQSLIPNSEIAASNQNAVIKVVKSTFTYKEFSLSSGSPLKALLFIHYFPGWVFSINQTVVKPNTTNIYDFVYLNVPAGNNRIVAEFTNTPLITVANYISFLSILILIIFSAFALKMLIPLKSLSKKPEIASPSEEL